MKNRNQTIKFILLILINVFAIGLLLVLINWFSDQDTISKYGESDFTTLSQSGMKDGIYVTGSINKAIGPYAHEYTADSSGNRKSDVSSDDYFYLVPVYSQDTSTIDHFVTFKADSTADKKAMEKIAQCTAGGTYAEPLKVEHGLMTDLGYQQKNILKNWVDEKLNEPFVEYCAKTNLLGTTDKDVILSKIMTYSISRTDSAGISFIYIILTAAPLSICILMLIVMRIKDKARKAKEAEQSEFGIKQPM